MTGLVTALFVAALGQAATDLATQSGGRDIFPPAFHGTWAPSLGECREGMWVRFDATSYRGPDNLATLIRNLRVRQHRAPGGEPALTLLSLAEFNSEGHVSAGRVRIGATREEQRYHLAPPEACRNA